MEYALGEAAKAAGLNRSTIFRAIKSGKLSARRLDDGAWRVDASELARVYGLQQPAQGTSDAMNSGAQGPAQAATGADAGEATRIALARLEERLQAMTDALSREREAARDLREQLAQERETAQETARDLRKRLDRAEERVLALSAPPAPQKPQEGPPAVSPAPEPSRPSKGLLARLLGR